MSDEYREVPNWNNEPQSKRPNYVLKNDAPIDVYDLLRDTLALQDQIAQLQTEKAELISVINKAIYATGDNSLTSALREAEELLNKLQ